MARKACPQCNQVTGASQKTCSKCGHAFAAVAVPAATGRPKRCAMCGIVNASSVRRCQCGFDFDQEPEDLRAFYRSRRANAWGLLIGSAALGVLGTAALALFVGLSPVIPVKAVVIGFVAVLGGSAAGCGKAMRILSATRINLDDLDGATDAVPSARVVKR